MRSTNRCVLLVFCLLHLLSWIRSESTDSAIVDLYHGKSKVKVTETPKIFQAENFASEGGTIENNSIKSSTGGEIEHVQDLSESGNLISIDNHLVKSTTESTKHVQGLSKSGGLISIDSNSVKSTTEKNTKLVQGLSESGDLISIDSNSVKSTTEKNTKLVPGLSESGALINFDNGPGNTTTVNTTHLKHLQEPEGGTIIGIDIDPIKSTAEKSAEHLKDLGSGTSNIKSRKGVELNKIVARKGVLENPATVSSELPTRTTIPVHEPSQESSASDLIGHSVTPPISAATTLSSTAAPILKTSTHVPPTNATTTLKPKKPTVTSVPADSDAFLKSLKTERNVVIPVLFLVLAPIVVLLALLIYKRVRESRDSDYMRMGFLIEDIYND